MESIGFSYARTKGSHAVYRHSDGRVVVIPEHGTIKRGTLGAILRHADLTPAEFLKLLDWPLTVH
ncbi:MAG: type II toxin-antitoxin system HicA family toxin [Streptosporangiaceae bacterium]